MRKLKILAVCGFGVGSSMILKMKIDDVLKANGMTADVFTTDLNSVGSVECDIVFTSEELEGSIKNSVNVPVIAIKNFIDKNEIESKGLETVKSLL